MRFLFFIVITFYLNIGVAQSFEQYLNGHCLEMAAYCAHPFFKFDKEKSSVKIFHKGAVLDIHYLEGVNTVLSLHFEDGIITKTELNYDSHFIPAFSTISLLKSLFIFKSDNEIDVLGRQIISYYEKLYKKSVEDFDATQITTATLSYYWAVFVTKNDKIDLSERFGTKGKPEAVEMVNGIIIKGSRVFVTRVMEALSIVETYDPEFHTKFLKYSNAKYNAVKGITMSTKGTINTIDEGHCIALHYNQVSPPDKPYDKYYLASVIVHETIHLHQYSSYAQLFDCKVSNYLHSYSHDPVAFAKKEISAHTYQHNFLKKLPANTPNLASSTEFAEQYIKDYTEAMEAGYLMFSSKGECGAKCKQQACAKMNPLYVRYGNKAGMDILNKLICSNN